ncbi:hypothetical protein PIB30_063307 [Stylosanthes scabra]|uniref:GRF-type domain-containing protein n=1 Tax=Stylosanthes scabra TaxID=79078 RepID=A0ABU6QL64_9FABA|nr:hypothetical protein [Stylosanthes scabra]
MASQNSRSSRPHSSSQRRGGLVCGHGERSALRVSRTKQNLGRRFWGYAYYEFHQACDFFQWVDSDLGPDDPEKVKLRKKVASLKIMVKRAERMKNVAVVFALVGWWPPKITQFHIMLRDVPIPLKVTLPSTEASLVRHEAKFRAEVAKESARNEKIAKKSLKAKSRADAYSPKGPMRTHCHALCVTS